MSYHGYMPIVKRHLFQVPASRIPSLLEIGIDRGVMLVPLVAFLARTRPVFTATGVDVKVQEQVRLMMANLDLLPEQVVTLLQENSLELLPRFVALGNRYDVVLLDGDHNYHTVSRELPMLESLVSPDGLIVCDDYDGRWSERDMWYAEREGYRDVDFATKRVETDKHGVKAAVDEWLAAHPSWQLSKPIAGEPVVLRRTT